MLLINVFVLAQDDSDGAGFDVYSIPDALNPEAPQDGLFFMNGTDRFQNVHFLLSLMCLSSRSQDQNSSSCTDEQELD